jgi:hypothetical protein
MLAQLGTTVAVGAALSLVFGMIFTGRGAGAETASAGTAGSGTADPSRADPRTADPSTADLESPRAGAR